MNWLNASSPGRGPDAHNEEVRLRLPVFRLRLVVSFDLLAGRVVLAQHVGTTP